MTNVERCSKKETLLGIARFTQTVTVTLHICHNHHNRWLCKQIQSSVKFLNGYVKQTKQTALILHKMCSFQLCSFTHSVSFYTQSVI